jgi:hypothetical protein
MLGAWVATRASIGSVALPGDGDGEDVLGERRVRLRDGDDDDDGDEPAVTSAGRRRPR